MKTADREIGRPAAVPAVWVVWFVWFVWFLLTPAAAAVGGRNCV